MSPNPIPVPPRFATSARWLRDRIRAWRPATGGVAAVEFALVLPLLVVLFFGLSEITLAVTVDRKLGSLSRTLADLTTRNGQISSTDLGNDFDAAVMILRPYNSAAIQMVVSSVLVSSSGNTYTGTVDWSCGRHLTTKPANMTQSDFDAANLKVRPQGSNYTVPPGFQNSSTQSFMAVETLMPYQPTLGRFIQNTINFREITPWPIRTGSKVTGPSSCPSG